MISASINITAVQAVRLNRILPPSTARDPRELTANVILQVPIANRQSRAYRCVLIRAGTCTRNHHSKAGFSVVCPAKLGY
jgi:hypothetical protein